MKYKKIALDLHVKEGMNYKIVTDVFIFGINIENNQLVISNSMLYIQK